MFETTESPFYQTFWFWIIIAIIVTLILWCITFHSIYSKKGKLYQTYNLAPEDSMTDTINDKIFTSQICNGNGKNLNRNTPERNLRTENVTVCKL